MPSFVYASKLKFRANREYSSYNRIFAWIFVGFFRPLPIPTQGYHTSLSSQVYKYGTFVPEDLFRCWRLEPIEHEATGGGGSICLCISQIPSARYLLFPLVIFFAPNNCTYESSQ